MLLELYTFVQFASNVIVRSVLQKDMSNCPRRHAFLLAFDTRGVGWLDKTRTNEDHNVYKCRSICFDTDCFSFTCFWAKWIIHVPHVCYSCFTTLSCDVASHFMILAIVADQRYHIWLFRPKSYVLSGFTYRRHMLSQHAIDFSSNLHSHRLLNVSFGLLLCLRHLCVFFSNVGLGRYESL